jgi:hypothetical protein
MNITRHQLGLNRPASAPPYGLFKRLPRGLRPYGLQSSAIFAILPLLHVVANFIFILFSLSSAGSIFSFSKNFSIPFVVKQGVTGCCSESFHLK